jgi:hypothetical protein
MTQADNPALPLAYVLPLRWDDIDPAAVTELTGYLRQLRAVADITVVDGSPPAVFAHHHDAWHGLVRHIAPDPAYRFANGKVNGVLTGVFSARHEHIVIADDDVRHTPETLAAIHRHLYTASVVRPQNYFDPMPWHARWDTARSLLNRAVGADYPGTLGVRRSVLAQAGGYDGDVLFENLELIRTVRACGGREAHARDVYVRRLPPETRRFWQQRVRQAYDEFAQPARMVAFLGVVPAVGWCVARGRHRGLIAAAATAVGLAELGRRRAGGRQVLPASATLFAPVWLLERGTCAWAAVAQRLMFGGVRYAGRRLAVAGHRQAALARIHAPRPSAATGPAVAPAHPGVPAAHPAASPAPATAEAPAPATGAAPAAPAAAIRRTIAPSAARLPDDAFGVGRHGNPIASMSRPRPTDGEMTGPCQHARSPDS